ncbi:MAG: alpha/beta hydrolase [Mastigocoleus sp. MO_167.B18]|nr:alpha/beta hydrolase [Mastigocoleus sp. MO_167.B18]
MFKPLGFEQNFAITSLGKMAYYTARSSLWHGDSAATRNLETLVFLHGFGGGSSAYEWSKVYPAFAAEYRIIAPDLVGWGNSEHPIRNYKVEDYLQSITEFLQLVCEGKAIIVASSLTAALVIRVAIANPELCKSLILMAPAGISDFGEDYSRSFFAQLASTPVMDNFLYNAGIATRSGIRNFLVQRQFAQPNRISDEMVEAYLQSAKQENAEYAALSFIRGDLCFDLAAYINKLETPSAILWGQKSQFTKPEIGQRLAQMNPQAIRFFQEIKGVGLTPQLELPAVTIGLIRKFLPLLE